MADNKAAVAATFLNNSGTKLEEKKNLQIKSQVLLPVTFQPLD